MVLFEPHISVIINQDNIIKPLSDLFKHGYKVINWFFMGKTDQY